MSDFKSTYIRYDSSSFEELPTNIKEAYKIAVKHYGLDRVSLNEEMDGQYYRYTDDALYMVLWIYYPRILITNSQKNSHEIKDLYVRLTFDVDVDNEENSGKLLEKFRIHRTTLTEAEYRANYIHSHVSPTSYSGEEDTKLFGCSNVCLGSGELVTTVNSLANKFDSDIFDLFLHQLDTFVAWESLEGGPYYKMSEVGYNSLQEKTKNCPPETYDSFTLPILQDSSSSFVRTLAAEVAKNPKLEVGVSYNNYYGTHIYTIMNSFLELQKIISYTVSFRRLAMKGKKYLEGKNVERTSEINSLVFLNKDLSEYIPFHTMARLRISQEYDRIRVSTTVPVLYFHGIPKFMTIERVEVNNEDLLIYSVRPNVVTLVKSLLTLYMNKHV